MTSLFSGHKTGPRAILASAAKTVAQHRSKQTTTSTFMFVVWRLSGMMLRSSLRPSYVSYCDEGDSRSPSGDWSFPRQLPYKRQSAKCLENCRIQPSTDPENCLDPAKKVSYCEESDSRSPSGPSQPPYEGHAVRCLESCRIRPSTNPKHCLDRHLSARSAPIECPTKLKRC